MEFAQAIDVTHVLKAIFDKPATVKDGTVSVNTTHELTPVQFTLLAQASFVLGVAPAIVRSGTGVKVAFSLTV